MLIEVINWSIYNPRNDMQSMPWLRLESDIGLSKKLFGLGPDQKWIWVFLISSIAREVKGGDNHGTYSTTIPYLAYYSGVPEDRVEAALKHFEGKGMIKIHPDGTVLPKPSKGRPKDDKAPEDDQNQNDPDPNAISSDQDQNGSVRDTIGIGTDPYANVNGNGNENDNSNTPPLPPSPGGKTRKSKTGPPKLPTKRDLQRLAKAAAVDAKLAAYDGCDDAAARERLSPFAWRLVELTRGKWERLYRDLGRAQGNGDETPARFELRDDFIAKAKQAWLDTGGATDPPARDPPDDDALYEWDENAMEDAHD